MATNPLVTMLMAALILKDPIRTNQRIGMIFSFLGVAIVISHGFLNMLLHFKISVGDLIILGANLCWALYSVLSRRYVKKSTPLMTTAMTMSIGALILLAFSGSSLASFELLNQNWQVYAALIYMALFGSVLAYLFWNYGIAQLGAGPISIFFNLVPVFTVVISIVAGQSISLLQIIGGMVVIFGVLISVNFIKLPVYFKKLATNEEA